MCCVWPSAGCMWYVLLCMWKISAETYWRSSYFQRPKYKSKMSAEHIGGAVTRQNCNLLFFFSVLCRNHSFIHLLSVYHFYKMRQTIEQASADINSKNMKDGFHRKFWSIRTHHLTVSSRRCLSDVMMLLNLVSLIRSILVSLGECLSVSYFLPIYFQF